MLRTGFIEEQVTRILARGGNVVAWGRNDDGQTTMPAGLSGVVAIAAGDYHTVALKSDGTVVAWGRSSEGQTTVPTGLSGVVAIAAGGFHNVALKSDNIVVAWGNNGNGQTTVPAGLSGVVAIAAGSSHTVALKSDGTVVAWGRNDDGQTTVPAGLSGVVAIAAGDYHTVALKSDGTVVAWGRSSEGQTTVPTGLSGVVAIAAGGFHNVALKSDNTVVAWGNNGNGQTTVPAGLSGVVAIAAGGFHNVALKSDNTVVAWGNNGNGQTTVPAGLSGVVAIAAGGGWTVVVTDDTLQSAVVGKTRPANSRAVSSGTGFLISEDGYLVTNHHVAGEGANVRLATAAGTIAARVVKVDKANDLALLKAEGQFTALPVITSRGVRLGGTAATVGFPNTSLQGFAPKLAKGEIASLAGARDDARHFQISAPVQPGNSGGALVDERGNVIGVVVAKLNQKAALATSGALAENVNYAVKSSYLLSFLESVPDVAARLKEPNTQDRKFEDVVKSVEQATVLVLVY